MSGFLARADTDDGSAVRNDYAAFLERLGFEDFSTEIRNTIKAAKDRHQSAGIGAVSEAVLSHSAERAEILNVSRRLAVEVAAGLESGPSDREDAERRAVSLAAKLLTLKPIEVPACLPIPTAT